MKTRITRRGLFACAAVSAQLLCGCGCGWEAWAETAPDAESLVKGTPALDRPLTKVSSHVYMIEAPGSFPAPDNGGFMSNLTFVVGREGIVAVDGGSSSQIAEMAIRQLRAMTRSPVVGLINTHFHGDHWLGNQAFVDAFGKDLPLYAHAGTRGAIEGEVGVYWRDSMLKWTDRGLVRHEDRAAQSRRRSRFCSQSRRRDLAPASLWRRPYALQSFGGSGRGWRNCAPAT